jgi:hypothetical protein
MKCIYLRHCNTYSLKNHKPPAFAGQNAGIVSAEAQTPSKTFPSSPKLFDVVAESCFLSSRYLCESAWSGLYDLSSVFSHFPWNVQLWLDPFSHVERFSLSLFLLTCCILDSLTYLTFS